LSVKDVGKTFEREIGHLQTYGEKETLGGAGVRGGIVGSGGGGRRSRRGSL